MITPTLNKVRITSVKEDQRRVIRTLHRVGAVHIEPLEDESIETLQLKKHTSLPGAKELGAYLIKLKYFIDTADITIETGITELPDTQRVIEEAKNFVDEHLDHVKELENTRKKYQEKTENIREQLGILAGLPAALDDYEQPLVYRSETKLDAPEIAKTHQTNSYYYYILPGSSPQKAAAAKKLNAKPCQRIDLSLVDSRIGEARDTLQKQRAFFNKKTNAKKREITRYVKEHKPKLAYLYKALNNIYDEHTIANKFGATEELVVIQGYIDPADLDELTDALPDCTIETTEAKQAPTKYDHEGIAKNFQVITDLFDTPKYGAFDPTRIMTFFYPLFFGFMLSDIGYGLLVLATMAGIRSYFGKSSKPYLNILGLSAASTIIFGMLFGSFFGNLIPIEPLYKSSFDASFNILIASLVIGLIHINLAVAVHIYQEIKQGKGLKTLLINTAPIPLLEATAVLLYFQQTYLAILPGLLAVTALLLKKGFMGLMDITDLLGSWFSYARLLALSLATAGIALAVNIIAQKISSLPYIGLALATLLLIAGHIFNYVINVIGCAINAARLHYVEFFSVFYEGGGDTFTPFKLK
jgi:vacuolar-type H+-ATPase subunit I/STV1